MSLTYDQRPMGSPPPFDSMPYVTRIKGRTPTWKQHANLNNANAAVRYWRRYSPGIELWLNVDGTWTLLESVTK